MKKIQISKLLLMVFTLFLGTGIYAQDKAESVGETTDIEYASTDDAEQTNIVGYLSASKDYSTLVKAVKAAGLVETLSGDGPFTVFAPTNSAFEKLGKAALQDLLKPENQDKLKSILTSHVIAGNADANSVIAAIENGKGKAEFKTVSGQIVTAFLKEGHVYLMDTAGNKVKVVDTDITQSNGVIHVLDGVLTPRDSTKSYK